APLTGAAPTPITRAPATTSHRGRERGRTRTWTRTPPGTARTVILGVLLPPAQATAARVTLFFAHQRALMASAIWGGWEAVSRLLLQRNSNEMESTAATGETDETSVYTNAQLRD